jgi:small subunit ribosomal protein S9
MTAKNEFTCATGRRKSATARVRIKAGTGKMTVNGKEIKVYFPDEAMRGYINQPMSVTDSVGKYDVDANIQGGGTAGQAGALIKMDESLKSVLKNCGMLTRDARVKERKKPGQPGARKRFQFSKR